MTVKCKGRVWDCGDQEDCNEKVFAYGYCEACLRRERAKLRDKIGQLRMEEANAQEQLRELGSTYP